MTDRQQYALGRIVAGDAMKFGWARLNAECARQFGTDAGERKAER